MDKVPIISELEYFRKVLPELRPPVADRPGSPIPQLRLGSQLNHQR